jgi:hypothetical protein
MTDFAVGGRTCLGIAADDAPDIEAGQFSASLSPVMENLLQKVAETIETLSLLSAGITH